jgi:hypothetical protein
MPNGIQALLRDAHVPQDSNKGLALRAELLTQLLLGWEQLRKRYGKDLRCIKLRTESVELIVGHDCLAIATYVERKFTDLKDHLHTSAR